MKIVSYEYCNGMHHDFKAKTASLGVMLSDIPYLFIDGFVLPYKVIESLLANAGSIGGGMGPGCKWQPIEITADDYTEAKEYLISTGLNPITDEIPHWVIDLDAWRAYIDEIKFNLPHEKHLKLIKQRNAVCEQLDKARETDSPDIGDLMLKMVNADSDLNEFRAKRHRA